MGTEKKAISKLPSGPTAARQATSSRQYQDLSWPESRSDANPGTIRVLLRMMAPVHAVVLKRAISFDL